MYLNIIRDFGKKKGNKYLSTFNKDDLEQLLNMGYKRRMEALSRFGLDEEAFNRAWLTEEAMQVRMDCSRVQPDAGALRILKEKGVKLAVITSAPKRAADVDIGILKGRIGSRIFNEVVMPSYEPTLSGKPDPSSVEACLERLSVSPQEAFGVGDSERDLETYQAAGVLDVLLDRSGNSSEIDMSIEPSVIIQGLEELLPLVVERGILSRIFNRNWGSPKISG